MNESKEGLQNEATPEEKPVADLTVVLGLIEQIRYAVADKDGNTLREDALRVAQEVLDSGTLKSPSAIKMLEDSIKGYSKK